MFARVRAYFGLLSRRPKYSLFRPPTTRSRCGFSSARSPCVSCFSPPCTIIVLYYRNDNNNYRFSTLQKRKTQNFARFAHPPPYIHFAPKNKQTRSVLRMAQAPCFVLLRSRWVLVVCKKHRLRTLASRNYLWLRPEYPPCGSHICPRPYGATHSVLGHF